MKKIICTFLSIAALTVLGTGNSFAQKATKSNSKSKQATTTQAQQAPPQRVNPTESIKEVIDRIYNYLDGCTPYAVVDKDGKEITDYSKIDENSTLKKGDFGINTYEWGVTYSGMLLASQVLGDEKYSKYVYDRLNLLGQIYPYVKKYYDETGYTMRLTALHTPKWLDDCGAMTAAMIKATLANPQESKDFRALLDNWFNFVMYKEYRFGDGILARNRPTTNSVWLDDMYMGITPIAYRAKLSQSERGDLTQKFYAEAINQCLLFKKYLWVDEMGFYRHGWIEGMSEHPNYHWARANGWAVLTLCDVLDCVPANTQGRDEVLKLLQDLLRGLAPYQSPEGSWHQLINKTESYLETSASAMYVYGYAHAVNQGWLDKTAYQDIAKAGWNAVAKQVNEKGQVENTCVGTGLGWTNTFYEGRPVSVFAAHGYGPVLLAAAEMLKLYQGGNGAGQQGGRPGMGPQMGGQMPQGQPSQGGPQMGQPGQMPQGMAPQQGGQMPQGAPQMGQMPQGGMMGGMGRSSRQEGKPMLFLAGDSTCKNGNGTGSNGQWGWGSFFSEYMSDGIVVENDAVGGLSSRTFFNNNWSGVRDQIKEGDYVIIQFGHNDMSPLGTGRARGTVNGTSDEPTQVVMEKNGASEDVYSYGHYVRMMVRQTKLRGGIPVIVSPTPQNRWSGEKDINRFTDTYDAWCKTVASEEGCEYVDFNNIAADKYNAIGKTKAQADYFSDSVHTKEAGARMYCELLSSALKGTSLGKYVK